MRSPQYEIRRIIRRALDAARPEAMKRIAQEDADGNLPLVRLERDRSIGQDQSRGMFNKRLVLSQDAANEFDVEVVLSCYNALRLSARNEGGLADVQEFRDRDDPHRCLAFAESSDQVLAYVPSTQAVK
ncbi:MAG: hypothetical protein HOP12_09690 [Candidatus Eisenbacteria bacterium]|uniref:Uncharacterized protein n=1 Tax=Eiseniibacteriota bacterium TaxID=2212470 RepID=A0A849SFA7_UNCEI|nr:hypothetical protein [Candidatus Eisenbacteria bacterium]